MTEYFRSIADTLALKTQIYREQGLSDYIETCYRCLYPLIPEWLVITYNIYDWIDKIEYAEEIWKKESDTRDQEVNEWCGIRF